MEAYGTFANPQAEAAGEDLLEPCMEQERTQPPPPPQSRVAMGALALGVLAVWGVLAADSRRSSSAAIRTSSGARFSARMGLSQKSGYELVKPSKHNLHGGTATHPPLDKLDTLPLGAKSPPHLIFMMVDDVGLNDVTTGTSDQYVPNMRALSSDGISLTRYYGMHLCTPARGAFLTGRYPVNIGLQHDVILPTHTWGLDPSFWVLPQMLSEADYVSHAIGKWHLGHAAKAFLPTERGFSSFFGYLTDQIDYYSKSYPYPIEGTTYKDLVYSEPGMIQPVETDSTTITTQMWMSRAREVIANHSAHSDSSLFLYYAIQNNHSPLVDVPDELLSDENLEALENADHEPHRTRTLYTKLNMLLDQAVGDLVAALKEADMYENSIIVVSSDNGACYQSGGSNFPYRGTKHYLFEGGVKVPAFIHSPLLPDSVRGQSFGHLFSITDWVPTFLHLAGLKAPSGLDGVNQWQSLVGSTSEKPARRELLLNYDAYQTLDLDGDMVMREAPIGAIIMDRYKLLVNEFNVSWYSPYDYPDETASHAECVNVHFDENEESTMLFDLSADPTERVELQDQLPTVVEQMQSRLQELVAGAMVPFFDGSPSAKCTKSWDDAQGYIVPWLDDDLSYIQPPMTWGA